MDNSIVIEREDRGMSVEIRPSQGLDIGRVVFNGVRHDWDRSTSKLITGHAWLDSWQGGLVRTAGLRNVGQPSEGHGLHGAFALKSARNVSVVDRADGSLISGNVVDGELQSQRSVEVDMAAARITMRDVVTNRSHDAAQAPILYHVNWGSPFLGPELMVDVPSHKILPRDPGSPTDHVDWRHPAGSSAVNEIVIEHLITPENQFARLTNPSTATSAFLEWTGLPRVHQWINTDPAWGVVAIEPANCSVRGLRADRAVGDTPRLAPGESRTTSLTITFRTAS